MSRLDRQQRAQLRTRRRLRRRVTAGVVVAGIIILGVIYGPRLISGNYHRATIERLATDALGRRVTIAGPIQLTLLPAPQLQAGTVTIGGRKGVVITAATLKLDLALKPLLYGHLRATRLTLGKPDVTLPWPLPGGAHAVAPPLWLASLHATVVDGIFHLGALTFTHADLSIFTGGPHAVLAASGSVTMGGVPVQARIIIADTGRDAPAPVTGSVTLIGTRAAKFAFTGTLDQASALSGRVNGTMNAAAVAALLPGAKPATGAAIHADLSADGALVALHDITASIDGGHFGGVAILPLQPALLLQLDLHGDHLALGPARNALTRAAPLLPVAAVLDLTDTAIGGLSIPSLHATVLSSHAGTEIQMLHAVLPAGATLSLTGTKATQAGLDGAFAVTAPHPAATLAVLRPQIQWLPHWPNGLGTITAHGRINASDPADIDIDILQGSLSGPLPKGSLSGPGPASTFTGDLRIEPDGGRKKGVARIAAALAFKRLVLDRQGLAALRAQFTSPRTGKQPASVTGPVVLTARQLIVAGGKQTGAGGFRAQNLLIDASLPDAAQGGGVAVRLAAMRIGEAQLLGHGAWAADGSITTARLTLTGPSARPVLARIAAGFGATPHWLGLKLFDHRFAATLVAAGPARALHTAMIVHLGTLRASVVPTVDLLTESGAGALSIHADNAVTLIRDLGGAALLGERDGLDWPGPGSVSLRAGAFVTGSALGLSDFVLSLGRMTANGRVELDAARSPLAITGRIDADTFALPAPGALLALSKAALASGFTISLPAVAAGRVDRGGETIARNAVFSLALRKDKLAPTLALTLDHASVAGGVLGGAAVLTGSDTNTPPTLSLNADLHGADAAALAGIADDAGLKLPLQGGSLDFSTSLTANGISERQWRDTLAGSLTISGHKLEIDGIDLAGAGAALASATVASDPIGPIAAARLLRQALTKGSTGFDLLNLNGTVTHGGVVLDHAALTGPSGMLTASGTINLFPPALYAKIVATPTVPAHHTAPALPIAVSGMPATPIIRPDIAPAVTWISTHKAKPPQPVAPAVTPPPTGPSKTGP